MAKNKKDKKPKADKVPKEVVVEVEPTESDDGQNPEEYPVEGAPQDESLVTTIQETTAWDIYNTESKKVDRELVKDWTDSLNSLLVFAAIFSAVLTAFIIESKNLLEQDSTETMVDVMIFYTNSRANGTFTEYTRPDFSPSVAAIWINCLLFGSLGASLVAALATVVALQWVVEFDAATSRGGSSPRDRATRRQYRYAGVKKWGMGGVIAFLPQLMYFSVALFFAGMIQWMMILDNIVGYIILAGAAVALLFYGLSTLIAVIFTSAPFKSPLSRFIYSTYHVLFVTFQQAIAPPELRKNTRWIQKMRPEYREAYKNRENQEVTEKIDSIVYDSLHWLAQQIGTSEGSHRKLGALLGELILTEAAQPKTPAEWEDPWMMIMTFVAQRHWSALHLNEQTAEDERELALLIKVSALPTVKGMIAPTVEYDYHHNQDQREYWSQHCITSEGFPSGLVERSPGKVPSALFLLSRDVPIPSLDSISERRMALRLVKWRNSEKKPMDVWKSVFTAAETFSPDFFNSCVYLLCNYARSVKNHPTPAKKQVIMSSLVHWSTREDVSSTALMAIVHVFEHLVGMRFVDQFDRTEHCIGHAAFYALKLELNKDVRGTHRSLILALARDLHKCSPADQPRRLLDVLGMIWLTPSKKFALNWKRLEEKHGLGRPLEEFTEEIRRDWIFYVDDSPEMAEAVSLLFQATLFPDVGVSWLYLDGNKTQDSLLAILQLFDNLLCNHSKITPETILRPLCSMLQMKEFTVSQSSLSKGILQERVNRLSNPFVHTIAYRAFGLDETVGELPRYPSGHSSALLNDAAAYMYWNISESDPTSLNQLRARLISDSPSPSIKYALEQSLCSPTQLIKMMKIFEYKGSCLHVPGPGHILCHLQTAASEGVIYNGTEMLFDAIPLRNLELPPISALLMVSRAEDLSQLRIPDVYDRRCFSNLWQYIESFRTKQAAMLSFLSELAIYHQKENKDLRSAYAAIILSAIERSLLLPKEDIPKLDVQALLKRMHNLSKSGNKANPFKTPLTAQQAAQLAILKEQSQRIQDFAANKFDVTITPTMIRPPARFSGGFPGSDDSGHTMS